MSVENQLFIKEEHPSYANRNNGNASKGRRYFSLEYPSSSLVTLRHMLT